MAESAGTHALVIGTSDYTNLPDTARIVAGRQSFGLGKVKSCAIGAFEFASWLKEKYNCPTAPLKSIRLLASPSLEEKVRCPGLTGVEPSNTANVRSALLTWWRQCSSHPGNVAIFYASGHGVQTNKDTYYVLLEDFAADELTLNFAIDVKAVFDGMAGDTMARKQFFFIDACRANVINFVDQSYGAGLSLPRMLDGPDSRMAPLVCSAAPGHLALAEPGEPPLFSKALIECLEDTSAYVSNPAQPGVKSLSYFNLIDALQTRLTCMSAAYWANQCLVLGGLAQNGVFQTLSDTPAPKAPVTLVNEPAAAHIELMHLGVVPDLTAARVKPKAAKSKPKEAKAKPPAETGYLKGPQRYGLRIVQNSEFLEYRVDKDAVMEYVKNAEHELAEGATDNQNPDGGWWWWSLCIEGSKDRLDGIKKVDYYLHESFGDKPYTRMDKQYRAQNFSLEMIGWGGFDLKAKVFFKDKSKEPIFLRHELQLFYPDGESCED